MQCIFCKIIKGEFDSAKLYEDDDVIVILDVNPVSKGHCLVIPKQHFENIFDISEVILQKVIIAGKQVAQTLKKSLNADGINLMQSNGEIAGQLVFHFHLHVIPRYEGDGINTHIGRQEEADIASLKKLAEKIGRN